MADVLEGFGLLLQTPSGQALALILSLVTGGIGFAFKALVFPKPEHTRWLRYSGGTFRIIATDRYAIPGLEVSVAGRKINQVSVTHIGIWNQGEIPIRQPLDIAPADPIRITIPSGIELFQAAIVHASRPACRISTPLSEDGGSINVVFDFLEKSDGFVLRLVHNGSPLSAQFKVLGTVIGARPSAYWSTERGGELKHANKLFGFGRKFDQLVAFGLWAAIAAPPFLYSLWNPLPAPWGTWIIGVMVVTLFSIGTFLEIRWKRLYPGIPATIAEHLGFERLSRPESSSPPAPRRER